MKKLILFSLIAVIASAQVVAKEIKTLVVTTTPQMHCQSCETRIKHNIRFEKGVKSIETNIDEQKVTITYDSGKTNDEKLIAAFEKFGYKARVVKDGEQVCLNQDEECPNM